MRIGVFDSGVGGLTVLSTLIKNHPNHEYIYYGDTLNAPYGNKEREEIINYANNIIKFLESENVDLIIIACGTVSSNVKYLNYNKKVIDIISSLQGKLDNYKNVTIIATPLSVKSNAFKNYIKTKINLVSCPKLVPLIEKMEYNEIDSVLDEYLQNITESDALLLGCTHYPIIKDKIAKYFNKDILSLDEFIKLDNLKESKFSLKIYFSYVNDNVLKNTKNILKMNNIKIERKILND